THQYLTSRSSSPTLKGVARSKEFDPDVVLPKAHHLFRERGHAAPSMAALVAHLRIGRGSLYATFAGKHELYMKALHRYIEQNDPSPVELLSQPGPALPAVRKLVELYLEQSLTDPRGCMVVNAAGEMLPGDRTVARFVENNWAAVETALITAMHRARAQGELPPDRDPRMLARFVFVFLQGLKVVAKGS